MTKKLYAVVFTNGVIESLFATSLDDARAQAENREKTRVRKRTIRDIYLCRNPERPKKSQ